MYLSSAKVLLEGFEEFIGLKVIDSCAFGQSRTINLEGEDINIYSTHLRKFQATTAKVLAQEEMGNPAITVNKYGKGRVFYVDAPIEANMIKTHNSFNGNNEKIYKNIFKDHINALPVIVGAKDVVFTINADEENTYLVVLNHTDAVKELQLDLKGNYQIESVIYGDDKTIKAYDAVVLKLKKV